MFLFRGTWLLLFIGLFFATTLTFANVDYLDYDEGSGEDVSCGKGIEKKYCSECPIEDGGCGGDCKWVEAHNECFSEEGRNANCKKYHQPKEDETGPKSSCHHDNFPTETIQEKFPNLLDENVKTCCRKNGYIFEDHCKWENRTNTNYDLVDTWACGYTDNSAEGFASPFLCNLEAGCQRWHDSHLRKNPDYKDISYNSSKKMLNLNLPMNLELQQSSSSFCAAYECNKDTDDTNKGWGYGFEACVCPKKFENEEPENSKFTRCCSYGLTVNKGSKLICPQEENKELNCTTGDWLYDKFEDVSNNSVDPRNQYCIGHSWSKDHTLWYKGLEETRYGCKTPCNGDTPCIRFCDTELSVKEKKILKDTLGEEGKEIFFGKSSALEANNCPTGQLKDYFNPKKTCKQNFELILDDEEVKMKRSYGEKLLDPSEYCLVQYNGTNIFDRIAKVCKTADDEVETKFSFYPYIMMASCFFLFATLLVYAIIPKLRPTKEGMEYTKLMLHYTFAMLMAFICLVSVQLTPSLDEDNPGFCGFLGFATQFFFLTAFTFMCMMSVEPYMQIAWQSRSTPKRYLKEVICGYSVPLLFLIMTGIAESSMDQCSKYRPRFNEKQCWFSDIESKSIWFFLPIGIALLINTVIFALTCRAVCALDKQARDLGITSGQRSKNMERFLTFLKLFLGMGILWIFEIISGGYLDDQAGEESWWVTDTLNMLQGVYIFVIFVFKRNVIVAIKEKFGGGDRRKTMMTIRGSKMKMTRKTSNSVLSTTLGSEAPTSKPFA